MKNLKAKSLAKLLVLLLSVALICAGVVIAVGAEDANVAEVTIGEGSPTEYATLQEALTAATASDVENATVKLLKNGTVENAVNVTNALTVDLNGYSITTATALPGSTNPFILFNAGAGSDVSVIGHGTITVSGRLFFPAESTVTDADFSIAGDSKGINIEHNDGTATWWQPFIVNYGGTTNIENITVNSTATHDAFMYIKAGTLTVNGSSFNIANTPANNIILGDNVVASFADTAITSETSEGNIIVTGANSTLSLVSTTIEAHNGSLYGNQNYASKVAISVGNNAALTVRYSTIYTSGISSISVSNVSNVNIYNSNIVSKKNTVSVTAEDGTVSSVDVLPTYIFRQYAAIGKDITAKDSYIEYSARLLAGGGNYSFIFDNTVICLNENQQFARYANIKLTNNSALIAKQGKYPTLFTGESAGNLTVGSATGVRMLLEEGTRFDNSLKNRILEKDTYSKLNTIVYPDGSAPIAYTAEGTSVEASTTYCIVFDPSGNSDAPYVVVKLDSAISNQTYWKDGAAASAETQTMNSDKFGTVHVYSPDPVDIWGLTNSTGEGGQHQVLSPTVNFRQNTTIWKYTTTGKAVLNDNATPKEANIHLGNNVQLQKNYNVFVFDYDIAGEEGTLFPETDLAVNARDSGNKESKLARLNVDGTITNVGLTEGPLKDGTVSVKLSRTEWNHVTIVVDTSVTNGKAYLYINGEYLGAGIAYSADNDSLGIYGARLNIRNNANGVLSTGSVILVDNVMVRSYLPLTSSDTPVAVANNGADYLIDGGKAWSSYPLTEDITIGGVAVGTVEDALAESAKPENAGAVINLNNNVTISKDVVTNGEIKTNGYNITMSKGSIPAKPIRDENGNAVSIVFDAAYADLSVTFKYYTGTPGMAEDSWTASVTIKVNSNLASSFNGTLSEIPAYEYMDSTRHWRQAASSNILGWSTESDPASNSAIELLSLEMAEQYAGMEVALYPVYDRDNATIPYSAIVVDSDGNFIRGVVSYTTYLWWGGTRDSVKLKYGETLVLQRNIETQSGLSNNTGKSSGTFIGGTDASKTYGIDLNGYSFKFDSNLNQKSLMHTYNGWFIVNADETLNIYSSREGGKIDSYGIQTENHYSEIPDNVRILPLEVGGNAINGYATLTVGETYTAPDGREYTYETYKELVGATADKNYTNATQKSFWVTDTLIHTVIVNNTTSNGTFTVTERYESIVGVASGILFDINAKAGAKLNIGAYESYAGSNLTIEATTLVRAVKGDSTNAIKIDGANIIKNSVGAYSSHSLFLLNEYQGSLDIIDANIINPADNNTIYETASTDGGIINIEDSLLIQKDNGSTLFSGNMNHNITVSGVTTNTILNKHENSTLTLGEGNTYVSTTGVAADGIENAIYDKAMEIDGNVISVTYVTLLPDSSENLENKYTYESTGFDYQTITCYFAEEGQSVGAEESDTTVIYTLPVLGYKSTATENTAKLIYNDLSGNAAFTEVYVKGTPVRNTEFTCDDYVGSLITAEWAGFDTAVIPEIINEDVTVSAVYTNASVTGAIVGPKVNVAVYSDFGVNIYVPKEHDYITSVLIENNEDLAFNEITIDSVTYNKYTVFRNANASEVPISVEFTVAEGAFTATKSYSINVVSYAEKVLAQGDAAVDNDLMYYMLNYAQEANKYFNEGVESTKIASMLTGNPPTAEYNYNSENEAVDAAIAAAVSEIALDVKADDLKYVFTLKGTAAVSVKLNGKEYKAEGNTITVGGLKVYDFAKDVTFVIDGTEYNYKFANCVNSYKTASDTAAQEAAALVEAFYQYAQAATAYKNAQTAK